VAAAKLIRFVVGVLKKSSALHRGLFTLISEKKLDLTHQKK